MAEQLIIRLQSANSDQCRWLVLDARGNRVGFPQQGELASAAALTAQRRVIVLLPGEEILQLTATVPGRNLQQIARAAPFAIEDQLAADIDDLFVAVLQAGNASTPSRFAVIERELLESFLERLHAAGIRPDVMLPDHAALPAVEAGETCWMLETDRLVARDHEHGLAASLQDVPVLLRHLPEACRLQLIRVEPGPPAEVLAALPAERIASEQEVDADRAFTELAANAATRKDGGLLQGPYKPETGRSVELERWRPAAIAVGLLLLLGIANWGLDVYRLQREEAFLEQQMEQIFKRAMPGSRYDPAQADKVMRARLGDSGPAGGELLRYLAAIGASVNRVDDARLEGFSFRNGRLEISVSVQDAQALEQLQNLLRERSTANVQLQSANSDGDRIEGRITLDGGAA